MRAAARSPSPPEMRRARLAPGPRGTSEDALDGANVRGLGALLPLAHVVLDPLVLVEVTVPVAADRAEMHEHVGGAVLWSDEAEALLRAEPLHGSSCHVRSLLPFAVPA